MNEIVALGKTDGSLRKDGFVYAHLAHWRFATKPGTKEIHSASLASMPRALFFEPRSEVSQSSGEHRKRQTAFAGNIVMGEEEAMRGKHATRIYPRIVV